MTAQPERAWTTADRLSAVALVAALAAGSAALVKTWSSIDVLNGSAWALGIVASALAGVFDLAGRRVPNALTLPLLMTALALAAARLTFGQWGPGDVLALVVAWAVCLVAWGLRLFGGGDAKLAMGLLGFFPTTAVSLGTLIGLLAGGLVYLTWGPDRAAWPRLKRVVSRMLGTRALPAPDDVADAYHRRADPAAAWIGVGFCLSLALDLFGRMA